MAVAAVGGAGRAGRRASDDETLAVIPAPDGRGLRAGPGAHPYEDMRARKATLSPGQR